MISLLRKLGGDYILDTNFAADMTILEEASELIERVRKKLLHFHNLQAVVHLG